jgi:hypothetical protein
MLNIKTQDGKQFVKTSNLHLEFETLARIGLLGFQLQAKDIILL